MSNKGKFITIYGINNVGKTTQAKRIVAKLNDLGKKAVFLKYPIYDISPTGPFINKILRFSKKQKISEEEFQMWYALNRFQFEPKLKKLLEEDFIVIAEDYIGTGLAWGASKGADLNWLIEINKNLLKEDFAILLDGERQIYAKEKKHIHESKDSLVNDCKKFYLKLAEKFGWEIVKVSDLNTTTEKILKIIKEKI